MTAEQSLIISDTSTFRKLRDIMSLNMEGPALKGTIFSEKRQPIYKRTYG
jgi:hypothetical protein